MQVKDISQHFLFIATENNVLINTLAKIRDSLSLHSVWGKSMNLLLAGVDEFVGFVLTYDNSTLFIFLACSDSEPLQLWSADCWCHLTIWLKPTLHTLEKAAHVSTEMQFVSLAKGNVGSLISPTCGRNLLEVWKLPVSAEECSMTIQFRICHYSINLSQFKCISFEDYLLFCIYIILCHTGK